MARVISIWVYNLVLGYVQREEEAEEIVQDTLLAAINGIETFNRKSTLKTWVYRIAINKCKDALKHKSRMKRSGHVQSLSELNHDGTQKYQPFHFNHPEIQMQNTEQSGLLFDAINALPERQKDALILAKIEQMPVKEVGIQMKLSPKAVESLLTRARINLKKNLKIVGISIKK